MTRLLTDQVRGLGDDHESFLDDGAARLRNFFKLGAGTDSPEEFRVESGITRQYSEQQLI